MKTDESDVNRMAKTKGALSSGQKVNLRYYQAVLTILGTDVIKGYARTGNEESTKGKCIDDYCMVRFDE